VPVADLNHLFRSHGIPWDLHLTHVPGDGARLARLFLADGADLIAVLGGDGTVQDVVDGMIGSEVPLLILPGGTGNLVASALHLPKDPEAAAALVVGPEYSTRRIDVGRMDQRHFLLRVGCGVEAWVLKDVKTELKRQFGKWAYLIAAVNRLQETPTAEYRITLDDEWTITGTGVGCTVANAGSTGIGGLDLAPRVDIADGRLDVVFLRKADVEGIASLVMMMAGLDEAWTDATGLDASHLVGHWQARKVRIETDPPLDMQCDGDLDGSSPRTVEVLPRALAVVVPPPFAE
jgi:YegS/Rv2252/BmrU family lipid kinase